jgi:SPP1 family phage portal protein
LDLIRLEFTNRIDAATVTKLVSDFAPHQEQAREIMRYYKGDDAYIMDRKSPDPSAPDNKVTMPYGRKIVNTVLGYLYKPGLIRYSSTNEQYMAKLSEVFDANREPIKTAQLGKQTTIHGVGYEYHYVSSLLVNGVAQPRFAMLPADEVIPIYDYEVESNLAAFVRTFARGDTVHAYVYYPLAWEHFTKPLTGGDFVLYETGIHPYPVVPLNVYLNNEERLGDIHPVKHLIDAYDTVASDSVNEHDRNAWSYLVLKGFGLSADDARELKQKRVFQNLDSEDAVSFLTKDINSEFIKFLADWFRMEIHNQSGIPDISDISFGASSSGTTIDKFIYLMELFTDPKEALFREGLINRIKIIDSILTVRDGATGKPDEIEITMDRNWPVDDLKNAEALTKYSTHVSEKTLLSTFAPFVKDVDAELKQLEEEKEIDLERVAAQMGGDDDAGDGEEDTREAPPAGENRRARDNQELRRGT